MKPARTSSGAETVLAGLHNTEWASLIGPEHIPGKEVNTPH